MKDRTNRGLFLMEAASPEHQRLVQCLVGYMQNEGYKNIKASGLDEFETPDAIEGYIPDVIGVKNGVKAIGEAERCEEIDSDHTKKQIAAFSGNVMTTTEKPVPLFLGVPEECSKDVKNWIDRNYTGRNIIVISCSK